jgi:glycosyltransferase involved in cell wall biosynthesis
MQKVSCIIPVYNEASRISWVLNILTQVKNIWEIICVDDASSDESKQIIQKKFPSVTIIQHTSNQWKTQAVKTWLQASNCDTIFLCDADLEWLVSSEVQNAVQIFFQKDADMVILKRENAPLHIKAFRWHVLITGERIMKKKDLNIITDKKSMWFELEVAINTYMMEKNKKCLWMPSSATNTFKTKKYGIIQWLQKDIEMYAQMHLIENKFLQQIIAFHIESWLDQPGIIDKLIEHFELIDDQP